MRENLERPVGFASVDLFRHLISSRRFSYIGFHGWGEPFLNEDIFEMVRYAESRGIKTGLITNGTLLSDKINKIFASNLYEIAFGVHKLSGLEGIEEDIRLLIKEKNNRGSRLRIFLDITAYNKNRGKVLKMIEEAKAIGIRYINLHRLFDLYGVDPSVKSLDQPDDIKLFNDARALGKRLGMKVFFSKRHKTSCKIMRYALFITWDGYLTPCCFLPNHHFGNVLDTDLNDILRSKEYKNFVKSMASDDICKRCIM
jgi:Predicted Fe-S oxidoreductases